MAEPNCHACQHLRITWDKNLPYECKGFGFQSKHLPSLVVRQTSGKDCELFRPKPRRDPECA